MNMYNPPHPGEFIHDIYLKPAGFSCRFLAKQLDVASSTLNRILKNKVVYLLKWHFAYLRQLVEHLRVG